MCGIVGRAGPLSIHDEKMFKTMLLLDYFRGQDSTGFAAIRESGRVEVLKVSDDPIILMQHRDFEYVLNGNTDAVWIGHNRATTVGATNRANAHPFTCEHITGVHNGTLERGSFTELANRLPEEYGTDSETIFAHMACYGIDDTISRMAGAWTLVWFDAITKTLNMIRNDERPLYTCEIKKKDGNVLTWASDYRMIYAARVMADDAGELVTDEEGYCYWPMPVDTLHTYQLEDLKRGEIAPETRELKGIPPAPKVVGFTGNTNKSSTSNSNTEMLVVKDEIEIVEISNAENPEGFLFGGAISVDDWNVLATDGCSYCGADIDAEDEGLLLFLEEQVVLCPACSCESVTTIADSFSTHPVAEKIG